MAKTEVDSASTIKPLTTPRWPQLAAKRQVRASRLDILDQRSSVHNTGLVGLFRLLHIVALVWLVTSTVCTYYAKGVWLDRELAEAAFSNFWLLITTWVYAVIYSFTGYGLHWTRRRWQLSKTAIKLLLYVDTSILMSSCLTIVRAVNWSVYPSVFIMSVAVIHFMKIHSFVDTSLCMEEQYALACAAAGGAAPDENAAPAAPPAPPETVLTLSNFGQFLLVPRLVYEAEWPKAPHGFRPRYFLGKLSLTVATLYAIFLVSGEFVLPVMKTAHSTSLVAIFAQLIVPLFLLDLLFFYVMFECILNMLAELTGYGDREFYQDWWNSTTWEEFARKWNFPVHEFFLRHIYLPIYAGGAAADDVQRKWVASTVTILYSAFLHEFFLAATLGFVSWYIIIAMLGQLPLFALSHYHRNTTLGNLLWCLGVICGIPFIVMLYGRDWSAKHYTEPPTLR